ncbi:MAG: DUF3592 domain-containing protein [Tahibacter sp.]
MRRRLDGARQRFVATRKVRTGAISLPPRVAWTVGWGASWCAALLILGVAYQFFAPAWQEYAHARGLMEQGVKADARIERLWTTDLDWSDPEHRSWRRIPRSLARSIHYRYLDAHGIAHGRDERVDRETFAPLDKGDEIDIVYSSTDPDDSLTQERAERLAKVRIELVLPGVLLFGATWWVLMQFVAGLRRVVTSLRKIA